MRDYGAEDVTIVVTTVERCELLCACIDSLLRTTPAQTSLVVFFNGTSQQSMRASLPLIERWPGPLTVRRSETVLPIEQSHAAALDLVSTRLVNFMGDDDLVLRPRLGAILDEFNRPGPLPAAVTTWARRIAGTAQAPRIGTLKALGPTTIAEWLDWRDRGVVFELLWPGAVLRTEALRAVGFEADFSHSLDNRIFTQLAQTAPVIAVPDDGFGYRIQAASISSSAWRIQHRHVRYVERCLQAQRRGEPEPSPAEFVAEERRQPMHARWRRDLRSASRVMFRRGGEHALSGRRLRGALHLAAAMLLWPPAFTEKVSDQRPRAASVPARQPLDRFESTSTLLFGGLRPDPPLGEEHRTSGETPINAAR